MADQGRWFKLWCSALHDNDLDNLTISDFGRWAKFGAHVKEQGTDGSIVLTAPARHICMLFQVEGWREMLECLHRLPHLKVIVTGVTVATVTFLNWSKYQGDNSAERVRKFRERVTLKKRREEKRGEEIRKEENKKQMAAPKSRLPVLTEEAWINILKTNPAYHGIDIDRERGKCQAWCETTRATFSRRRFVNWLNRAERPINGVAKKDEPKWLQSLQRVRAADAEREQIAKEKIHDKTILSDSITNTRTD